MYIIKNALKNILRSKSRSILIGCIVLVISLSACIGLSIKQASNYAKEQSLSNMTITAQISVDRSSMMQDFRNNRDSFTQQFAKIQPLSITDMQNYAKAESVKSFYYTLTVSMNGNELDPVITEETDDESVPGGIRGGFRGMMGDFTVVGVNSDDAMTDFINGVSTITEGKMFEEGTDAMTCIISDGLAAFNDISIGDTIKLVNPNKEDEIYTLTVEGIYKNSQSTVTTSDFIRGSSAANDPDNRIYLSYSALSKITEDSKTNEVTTVDEKTQREISSAIKGQVSGTYVFEDIDDYYKFEGEAREMGLGEEFTISSTDVNKFEQSLVPLQNLSNMSTYFLFVILGIGAAILIVINLFNIRERKYEVGVLTAIGMKKSKVALQFISEIFIITLIFVLIGGTIGVLSSVPVTNSLLEISVESEQANTVSLETSFRRPVMGMPFDNLNNRQIEYVSDVTSAANLTVFIQLIAIGVFLTVIASLAATIFIMRYEPLRILSNRD